MNRFSWSVTGIIIIATGILILSCLPLRSFNLIYNQLVHTLRVDNTSLSHFIISHPDVGHIAAYSVFTLILFFSMNERWEWRVPVIAFVFGGVVEVLQLSVPTRGSSLGDLAWNFSGILLGTALWRIFRRITDSKS
ncbi:VanZ family protein [Desulfoluna limicola]|uniref:VanZ family protein n=1 Tax=Desulfoluna limicola TaxID=2810562 RepID=UPI003BF4A14D